VKGSAEQSAKYKAEAKEKTKSDQPPDDVKRGRVDPEELDRELSSANVQVNRSCENTVLGFRVEYN
jgi:hypothetical protein